MEVTPYLSVLCSTFAVFHASKIIILQNSKLKRKVRSHWIRVTAKSNVWFSHVRKEIGDTRSCVLECSDWSDTDDSQ